MKKNILITGATGNLGKAAVAKFITEGYRVHATITPGKTVEFDSPNDVVTYPANLTDENSAADVIAQICAQYKTLDAALLLVGGYASGSLLNTNGDLLNKMFSLNFFTAYHAARPAFQQMITQQDGGRIVFIGSRPALIPADGKKNIAYALAKSLVFKLADLLNAEGKDKNVISSVIVPSTIDTPENRSAMPEANFSNWVTPEAIAESIYFLVSSKGNALREPVLKLYNKS
jgi:NAD(P)-dependent dehydrogenase (short-subunit alcohol dehydrogenase family)